MIQESTKTARMGAKVKGSFLELLEKTTGLVGGVSLYSFNVDEEIVCSEQTFELRERPRPDGTGVFQSPSFTHADGRALSISAISRRNADGKFNAKSKGLELIEKCQTAAEVAKALVGKTLRIIGIETIELPAYGKPGMFEPVKQYAFEVK